MDNDFLSYRQTSISVGLWARNRWCRYLAFLFYFYFVFPYLLPLRDCQCHPPKINIHITIYTSTLKPHAWKYITLNIAPCNLCGLKRHSLMISLNLPPCFLLFFSGSHQNFKSVISELSNAVVTVLCIDHDWIMPMVMSTSCSTQLPPNSLRVCGYFLVHWTAWCTRQ